MGVLAPLQTLRYLSGQYPIRLSWQSDFNLKMTGTLPQ